MFAYVIFLSATVKSSCPRVSNCLATKYEQTMSACYTLYTFKLLCWCVVTRNIVISEARSYSCYTPFTQVRVPPGTRLHPHCSLLTTYFLNLFFYSRKRLRETDVVLEVAIPVFNFLQHLEIFVQLYLVYFFCKKFWSCGFFQPAWPILFLCF